MTMALVPDAMAPNEQVELLAQTGGTVRCTAKTVTGGGSAPTVIFVPMDDDQVFNGDGSGGALQLSPITILANDGNFSGNFVWDFTAVGGVEAGWIVFFNVLSPNASPAPSIDVRNNNVTFATLDSTSAPNTGVPLGTPYAIYYDGAEWTTLSNRLGTIT